MLWKQPICTVLIYEFPTLPPSLSSSMFKVVWVYPFALGCSRRQLWNSEPSLEFGQWIFVKFEGAHNGISRDRVYASCISLYVLHFRAISQKAPLCNVYLAQKCKHLHCLVWKSSTSFPSGIIPAVVLYLFVHMPLLENAFLLQTDVNKYSTAHMVWRVCQQKISIPDYWLLRTGMFPNLFITSLYRSSFLPPLDISEIYLPPIIKINTSAFPPQCPNSN